MQSPKIDDCSALVWPGRRFGNSLGICHVVLLTLHEWLHVGRRNQPHLVAQIANSPAPMMRTGTGLHCHHARWLRGQELQQLPPRQLPAEDHRSIRPCAMRLKHVLGQIQADDADLSHGRFPSLRRFNTRHIGTSMPPGGVHPIAYLGRLSGPASQTRHPDLHERARALLRQRNGRNVLQDHQVGADLAGRLAIPTAGRKRRRQIHRRVL